MIALQEMCAELSPTRIVRKLETNDLYFFEIDDGEQRRSSCAGQCSTVVRDLEEAASSADARPRAIFYENGFYADSHKRRRVDSDLAPLRSVSFKDFQLSSWPHLRDWADKEGWWATSFAPDGDCEASNWTVLPDGSTLLRTSTNESPVVRATIDERPYWCMRVEHVEPPTAKSAVFREIRTATGVEEAPGCALVKRVHEISNEGLLVASSEDVGLICPALMAGHSRTDCPGRERPPMYRELLKKALSYGMGASQ
ncbi:MAG TPA: hypothetical protein PLN33_21400 [Hyphomonadaceae bacterium]|nr:hypothetical protein [Hyphomonadaceae bacterium]